MSMELRVFERGSGSAKKKHLMFKVDGSAMGLKKALPVLDWTDHSGDRYVSWESLAPLFIRAALVDDTFTGKVWVRSHPN